MVLPHGYVLVGACSETLEADTFGSGGFDDFSPFGGSFYNDSMYSPGYLDMGEPLFHFHLDSG